MQLSFFYTVRGNIKKLFSKIRREGRDKSSLIECKGGDHRNLTANKRGGLLEYYRALGEGETGKFKLNFSDPLPSLLPGDKNNFWGESKCDLNAWNYLYLEYLWT